MFATALPPSPSAGMLLAAVVLVWFNAVVWHLFLALAFSHNRLQAVYQRWHKVLSRCASALVGVFGLRLLTGTLLEWRSRD